MTSYDDKSSKGIWKQKSTWKNNSLFAEKNRFEKSMLNFIQTQRVVRYRSWSRSCLSWGKFDEKRTSLSIWAKCRPQNWSKCRTQKFYSWQDHILITLFCTLVLKFMWIIFRATILRIKWVRILLPHSSAKSNFSGTKPNYDIKAHTYRANQETIHSLYLVLNDLLAIAFSAKYVILLYWINFTKNLFYGVLLGSIPSTSA